MSPNFLARCLAFIAIGAVTALRIPAFGAASKVPLQFPPVSATSQFFCRGSFLVPKSINSVDPFSVKAAFVSPTPVAAAGKLFFNGSFIELAPVHIQGSFTIRVPL